MRITCTCGQAIETGDETAGRTVQCPACRNLVPAPGPAQPPAAAAQNPGAPDGDPHLNRLAKCAAASLWCGILAMASYVLMVVLSVVLALITRQAVHSGHVEPPVAAGVIALFLMLAAMVLSILALVLGSMGRKPENTRNRGIGLAGMIIGIAGVCLMLCCIGWFVFLAFAGLGARKLAHPPQVPNATSRAEKMQ